MSILNITQSENVGLVKELDEASIDLIFSNLQESQYSFPHKSFIREVASNAFDSIKEKNIAVEILKNNKPIEDYYLTRTDAALKDSNFNSSYYDFNHLNLGNNKVIIKHVEREEELKNLIIIQDQGVGLSPDRLRKYTKLGWSSKRNTRFAIGKFGINGPTIK